MLHSSTKQLLLGGLGAWHCLATDWELCGYAKNKERGNISCIKMQYPRLDDLSSPSPYSRMAALKDPLAKNLHPVPPSMFNPCFPCLTTLQSPSKNHPPAPTSPECQAKTGVRSRGTRWKAAVLTARSLTSHPSATAPSPFSSRDMKQLLGLEQLLGMTHQPLLANTAMRFWASISGGRDCLGNGGRSSHWPLPRAPRRLNQHALPGEWVQEQLWPLPTAPRRLNQHVLPAQCLASPGISGRGPEKLHLLLVYL